ncbi:vertnin [Esox lucius]|uniref:Vertnin n=1 Tax=Esox lucius TaxID=8010 RepID=A0AAY5KPB5_ESOLU|nr:vertnin [Esox lucius]XP_010881426.2 vertnin [Esox lucius]XP_010881427.2 vertnin [Esox lucius]XP_019911622.2 vertnin [Esox lucius]
MIQRKEIVLSVLGELQDATESSGLDALTRVALEVHTVLNPFPLPGSPCREFPDWTSVDRAAHALYPADAPGGLLPLACSGAEGNLLFDAASVLLVGTTVLSLELQVRTVVEMLLWKRYYLCGMIDSKVMLQAARFSLCADESEEMLNLPLSVLEAIFDADVKASCFPGSYANMWHLYALSSVLQCNIYSVYPMYNLKIRPYFNRLIRPRSYPKDRELITTHIMWSGELEGSSTGSRFRPRVFVALVQTCDLQVGRLNTERRVPPLKSLELLDQDSDLSYSSLKDKYNITKSTFYRWRRQTQEHRKKSATRYEAKHFLQACYLEGKLIPLYQFKEFFPEISRSTYYAWKHELISSGGSFSSTGEVSPGNSTEQETWSSPESKPRRNEPEPERQHHDSVAGLFGLSYNSDKMDGERAQNLALMQEAKKVLQNCIAMNTSFPFRIFKRSFPGISRSTYYNWRREAMLFTRGYKAGSCEDSSDADKSTPTSGLSPAWKPDSLRHPATVRPRVKVYRNHHKGFRLAFLCRKRLRDAAKVKLWKSRWSLSKFKVKFPSLSLCFYWLWRNGPDRKRKEGVTDRPAEVNQPEGITENHYNQHPVMEKAKVVVESGLHTTGHTQDVFSFRAGVMEDPRVPATAPTVSPASCAPGHARANTATPTNDHVFVMDLVALANFKAKAKLFLQHRFEEKSFPTFREFRSFFPLTPRSTYYMWKRALHHGVPLVHATG